MNRGHSFGFRTAGIILGGLAGSIIFGTKSNFLSAPIYIWTGTAGFIIGEFISRGQNQ